MPGKHPYLRSGSKSGKPGVTLEVLVAPRASRVKLLGPHNGRLKVALTSPPLEGRANTQLIEVLAKAFGCPKRSIEIVGGLSSREKRLEIAGMSLDAVAALLDDALNND